MLSPTEALLYNLATLQTCNASHVCAFHRQRVAARITPQHFASQESYSSQVF
eukprot:m.156362 g.156362  ORF g.156362 m.156362 type:complete len:52 (+) comp17558_c1_seq2:790-945(+)